MQLVGVILLIGPTLVDYICKIRLVLPCGILGILLLVGYQLVLKFQTAIILSYDTITFLHIFFCCSGFFITCKGHECWDKMLISVYSMYIYIYIC